GIFSRGSSTHIDPPKKNCALRILLNLGYEEVYHLDPLGSGLDEDFIYLQSNKYIVLGPIKMCDYKIHVDNSPIIKIPSNPTDPNSKKTMIRPNKYLRITIIFDYEIDEKLMETLNQVSSSIPKIKVKS